MITTYYRITINDKGEYAVIFINDEGHGYESKGFATYEEAKNHAWENNAEEMGRYDSSFTN